jgi:spore coat protein CotH
MYKISFFIFSALMLGQQTIAQKLPSAYHYSTDSSRIIRGNSTPVGLYNPSNADTIQLIFSSPDYWSVMLKNHYQKTDLPASFIYKGKQYDSAGVRFKGMTSYNMVQGKKKSFNITLDYAGKQSIDGYTTLNLHNFAEDPSMMREYLYYLLERKHTPAAKASYVVLMINGQSHGIYLNVQQLDKQFAKEWFGDAKATRWRAESSRGMGRDSMGMPPMGMRPFGQRPPDSIMTMMRKRFESGQISPFGNMNADSGQISSPGMLSSFGGPGMSGGMPPFGGMFNQDDEDSDSLQALQEESLPGGFPFGPGGAGFDMGAGFGAGRSSLNYLGEDTTSYQINYTLKKASKKNPWQDLINATRALQDTASPYFTDSLAKYLDIDASLWYLAHEILFTDDDGYVSKGGMDYYLYFDQTTGRIVPVEVDGNSTFIIREARTWGPFYKENNQNYPLLHNLLMVPELRQRYLAHLRTILSESFDTLSTDQLINTTKDLISPYVASDSIKLFTVRQFNREAEALKRFVRIRRQYMFSFPEVCETGAGIAEVKSVRGKDGSVHVTARLEENAQAKTVNVYFGKGISGKFEKLEMLDDGKHGDGKKKDGVYGALIQASGGDEIMRYYIESVAGNPAGTRCYSPAGAEHDVYISKKRKNF